MGPGDLACRSGSMGLFSCVPLGGYLTFLSLFSYGEGELSNNTLWEYWEN